jgi:soluble lytic murein transglycosylase-like protein
VERGDMRAHKGLIRRLWFVVLVGWAFQAAFPQEPDPGEQAASAPSAALPGAGRPDGANPADPASICVLVEEAAQAHGLPYDFFARLIWRESRFNPALVGPATRNGQRAQGIAQFMPGTAKEHGAFDPFDPVAALPKSAEFLRELRTQFGNLGLAAAAYNAGPKRVRDWLAGRSSLPGQTRSYVSTITGRSADDWARHRDGDRDAAPSTRPSCGELIALLKAEPVLYADGSEPRVREYAEL